MRIAIVIEQLDLSRGGAERSTFEFAEKLAERGLRPTILTGNTKQLPRNRRCEIVDLQIKSDSRLRKLMLFCKYAEQFLRPKNFDIIHAITPIRSADIYQPRGGLIEETHRQNVMRRTGLSRLVKQLVGPNIRQRYIKRLEHYLAEETNCIFLAVSDYVRQQCKEHLHLRDNRIKVIFNGIELSRVCRNIVESHREAIRTNIGISENSVVGLFVANNFKLKGLGLMIDSLAYLKQNRANVFDRLKVLIAGTDRIRNWFEKVHKLGLESNVIFIGPVSDVSRMYNISDFLIHPSWYDPCSRVVLEAIGAKLAVITSKYNGASELLRESDCGYIIGDMSSPKELAGYIEKMCDDNLRKKLSDNTEKIVCKISMETHINHLIEFYHQCLEL